MARQQDKRGGVIEGLSMQLPNGPEGSERGAGRAGDQRAPAPPRQKLLGGDEEGPRPPPLYQAAPARDLRSHWPTGLTESQHYQIRDALLRAETEVTA